MLKQAPQAAQRAAQLLQDILSGYLSRYIDLLYASDSKTKH